MLSLPSGFPSDPQELVGFEAGGRAPGHLYQEADKFCSNKTGTVYSGLLDSCLLPL